MAIETTRDVQQALKDLGWPIEVDGSFGERTKEAVTDFQRGFAFHNLLIDGYAGPQTRAALAGSLWLAGAASPHFKFREFKSKGNGWIKVNRHLIRGLELIRGRYGPFTPVSGYRDPLHNRKVGGAPNSQHVYGNAIDAPRSLGLTVPAVRNIGSFSGIGYRQSDGIVVHVDVRHLGPNTTGATVSNPTIWKYGT
jgi:zinc D-Ala-D-Ala carboxypeptidase